MLWAPPASSRLRCLPGACLIAAQRSSRPSGWPSSCIIQPSPAGPIVAGDPLPSACERALAYLRPPVEARCRVALCTPGVGLETALDISTTSEESHLEIEFGRGAT